MGHSAIQRCVGGVSRSSVIPVVLLLSGWCLLSFSAIAAASDRLYGTSEMRSLAQNDGWSGSPDCGRHTLLFILHLANRPAKWADLANLLPVSDHGSSLRDIAEASARLNHPLTAVRCSPTAMSQLSLPAIAQVETTNNSRAHHYVARRSTSSSNNGGRRKASWSLAVKECHAIEYCSSRTILLVGVLFVVPVGVVLDGSIAPERCKPPRQPVPLLCGKSRPGARRGPFKLAADWVIPV